VIPNFVNYQFSKHNYSIAQQLLAETTLWNATLMTLCSFRLRKLSIH